MMPAFAIVVESWEMPSTFAAFFAASVSASRRSLASMIDCLTPGHDARTLRKAAASSMTSLTVVQPALMDALRFSSPNSDRSPKKSPTARRRTTIMRASSMTIETVPDRMMHSVVEIEPLWQIHSFCGKISSPMAPISASMNLVPHDSKSGTLTKVDKQMCFMMSARMDWLTCWTTTSRLQPAPPVQAHRW